MRQAGPVLLLAITIAVLYLIASSSKQEHSQFQTWKQQFNIKFGTELEEQYRRIIFEANLQVIMQHNSDQTRSYSMGVNQFTALSQDEFVHLHLGTLVDPSIYKLFKSDSSEHYQIVGVDVDWVANGAVTPVKNQGQCSSCWAFSCTGSLEGLSKVADGILRSFSEQQLVDCSGSTGNMGCNGGMMTNAFNYVKNHGICQDEGYPYKAAKQSCKSCTPTFFIAGYTAVSSCSELANALGKQPISATVDATNWSSYSSGVFNKCGSNLNHGVVVVGLANGVWKVKNSWGNAWGQRGYIRLAAGDTCGLCKAAAYPFK